MFTIIQLTLLVVTISCSIAEPINHHFMFRKSANILAHIKPDQHSNTFNGYAPAGVTPSVPFELPTETKQPDTAYASPETVQTGQPDNAYGPPNDIIAAQDHPDAVYGPPGIDHSQQSGVVNPLPSASRPQPSDFYGVPNVRTTTDIDNTTPEFDDPVEGTTPAIEISDVDNDTLLVSLNDDGSLVEVSSTLDKDNVREIPVTGQIIYQRHLAKSQPIRAIPQRFSQRKLLHPINIIYTNPYII